jgi:SAM-dependent methyltransferase
MRRSLHEIIKNVSRGDDGVWRTLARSEVSYPDQGHDTCHGVENDSFWFAHRNRCIAAAIRRDPPDRGLPFADVGGGNGYVASMIADLGFRVVLVEPGSSGIAHAKERGLEDLVQASVVDLDIEPGTFGAIGMFDVIEHIEHDHDALNSLWDILVDGGKIYATVPAHEWLWSTADLEAGHFRRYTVGRLRKLFAECGFDVGFCSYYFWPLPLPMFLFRSLHERLRFSRPSKPRAMRVSSEHRRRSRILQWLLSWEENAVRRGRRVPFGASCILVATKREAPRN